MLTTIQLLLQQNGRKDKPPELNSTVWPEPTRMRTTGFTRVTTMQVTGATVDSCFVLVGIHKHGIAFQPQAKSYKGELKELFYDWAGQTDVTSCLTFFMHINNR